MRRLRVILASTLAVGVFAGLTWAQERIAGLDRPQRLQSVYKVSEWIGADVQDPQQGSLGEVDDVLFSRDGELSYLSVEHGGVAGVGATYVGVPASIASLGARGDEPAFLVEMDPERFAKAPAIESENYTEFGDAQWLARNSEFFRIDNQPPRLNAMPLIRATVLLGADLMGPADEKIGEVEDLIVDQDRKLVFAIISSGEVLGIGGDHIAVPFHALGVAARPDSSRVGVSLNMTRAKLEAAPLVKGDDYRQLTNADFVRQLYDYFPVVDPK